MIGRGQRLTAKRPARDADPAGGEAMAKVRLHQVNLITHNMRESLAFYRRLGLDFPEGDVWESGGHLHHARAEAASEVSLEFESRELAHAYNAGFGAARGRVVVGLALDSREAVDTLWEELISEGAQGLQPPFDAFWGARYAIVEDPDGNQVGLMSPVDPARRSPPPDL
jgi:uncharacterized glyoxalase superfamily protein PhnB